MAGGGHADWEEAGQAVDSGEAVRAAVRAAVARVEMKGAEATEAAMVVVARAVAMVGVVRAAVTEAEAAEAGWVAAERVVGLVGAVLVEEREAAERLGTERGVCGRGSRARTGPVSERFCGSIIAVVPAAA